MCFKKHTKLLYFIIFIFLTSSIEAQTNTPPNLTATGDQYYCPQSQLKVVTNFNIIDPDDTEIEAVYMQISTGYVNGEDSLDLSLPGSHPNISTSWIVSEGKLTLKSSTAGNALYTDLIAAVKDVVFESTSANPTIDKTFSITIGDANYLPSTGHFYEYIPSSEITWTNAKTAAESRTYFGLQGYLTTITSAEEAQLSGEQAAGQGWIGGSDAAVEGTWRWVTGPEAGQSFWFGESSGNNIGADFTFENWAGGEPNDWPNAGIPDEENYLHVYNDGRWNDYPNYNSAIQGYIVEYGGTPGDPTLNISDFTTISMAKISATNESSTCGTGYVSVSATSNTGFVIWFNSLGAKLGGGDTYSSTISTTTTYYALASADGVCETGNRIPIVATFYNIPTITAVSPAEICNSGTSTLTATASAGIINWYSNLTGGTPIETGNTFTTPSLINTTTYYVDATENGCTTPSRTPVTLTVFHTDKPTSTNQNQSFCDIENTTLNNLLVNEIGVLWYTSSTGGTSLDTSTLITNNTTYYASQILNGCESPTRLAIDVLIYETVIPSTIIPLEECDTDSSGSDTDGFTIFDLTLKETGLLNGKNTIDFTMKYFENATYLASSEITNPSNFENTTINGQIIYVRIFNNIDNSCFTDNFFEIKVNTLPIIQSSIVFKNCDEDGTPDGNTDFNLDEASTIITNGNDSLAVTYHLSIAAAKNPTSTAINPFPFNNINAIANTVYARVENSFGCYRIATIKLDVSVTSFPTGFKYEIENCDADTIIDGLHLFDLTAATQHFLTQLPPQNLSVHYYRNLTDAQLELNEISPQDAYLSEVPYTQTLYVRVENDDNGDCFGIGEHLTLSVLPRPEFEVNSTAIVCLNLPPITLETYAPLGVYSYQWKDHNGTLISTNFDAIISSGGTYTVIATSIEGCESFPQTITVSESNISTISLNDITITDDSENNSIAIDTTNLGIGDYEFALKKWDGYTSFFQDEPFFEYLIPGIYTVFIQDKNRCGIASIDVSVIGFPKFFTPNNDGINDTWKVLGVNETFYPNSNIYIFDRFGKLIIKINPEGNGWNGIFNGQSLPATDYWFSVELIDRIGNIRTKKGHFSLIRR